MGEHKYNIDEASRLSGITVRSLRNYVNHYCDFLNLKRGPYNSLLFSDDDLTVLVKIKTLLRDGKSRQEIMDILSGQVDSPAIEVTRTHLPSTEAPVILPILKKIDSVLTELLEENRQLHLRLEKVEARISRDPVGLPSARSSADKTKAFRTSFELPIPYFFLATKDCFSAWFRSVWNVFIAKKKI